jgi:RNA polymerase sigma-70 factor (ECF subfamily)
MNRSGDQAELSRLVLEHMEDALRLATRLCGDRHDAEDVVQEALYRAARGWKSFRRESKFRTWLFRIVVNVFRDRRRTARPYAQLPVDVPEHRCDHVAALSAKELECLVADCIARLPPRQKEVLVLRIIEEVPPGEAARILDTNEANIHATLHAARSRLKQLLAPYLDLAHRE